MSNPKKPASEKQRAANLRADLIAIYQPANSQELFAIERIALAQQAMLRIARLESGLLTSCLNEALDTSGQLFIPMSQDLVGHGDIEITKAQNRNYALADGFQRMTSNQRSNTWPLFLRYKVLTEREYRRALEDFERLKALRHELPNEPISEAQPEPNETTCDPLPTDPIPPQQPVRTSPESPPGPPPAPPHPANAANGVIMGFIRVDQRSSAAQDRVSELLHHPAKE
jgi:hypothetical protein